MPHPTVSDTILEILPAHHLLTAPELLDQLHQQGKNVNKTSVYRALEKLEVEGAICKHNLINNELAYEVRDDHHDHLICTHCGKITTAECQIDVPRELHGYVINHHHLSLYGLCHDCQTIA